ncbi:MAG: Gfo/Idh/MocA family oxidoreductase [Verrucomicrobia bacterium]|nr:Gfo/Idh/MocA family oxidoreductase [Verrucomicrobiota bacterium]
MFKPLGCVMRPAPNHAALSERVLRVGFVGCGGFIRGNHLPNLAGEPGFKIRALCDLKQDVLDELRMVYSPDYVTTRFSDLANDKDLDLIIIGTSPHVRVSLIREAAIGGKAIFTEKPMSMGWDDTREILRILKAHPVPFMVGMNRPYSRIMQEVKRIFDKHRKGPTLIQTGRPVFLNWQATMEL